MRRTWCGACPRTAFCSRRCNKELPMSSFPPGQVSHGVRMKLCVGCAEVRYVYTCSLCHFKKGCRGFGERPARGKHPVRLKCNVRHFYQGCEGRKDYTAFSPEQLNPRAHRVPAGVTMQRLHQDRHRTYQQICGPSCAWYFSVSRFVFVRGGKFAFARSSRACCDRTWGAEHL